MMKAQPTGYWTFMCNPKRYQVDKCLEEEGDVDGWMVAPFHAPYFSPGQLGVIRVGVDGRSRAVRGTPVPLESGVYAVVEILSKAKLRSFERDAFWVDRTSNIAGKPFVDMRVIHNLVHKPLTMAAMRRVPAIAADPYLISGQQSSTMPLQPEAYRAILSLIHGEGKS